MQSEDKPFYGPRIAMSKLFVCRWSAALVAVFISAMSAVAASNPKYASTTAPLSRDHSYFQNPAHPAYDYWALSPYYVPQLDKGEQVKRQQAWRHAFRLTTIQEEKCELQK